MSRDWVLWYGVGLLMVVIGKEEVKRVARSEVD